MGSRQPVKKPGKGERSREKLYRAALGVLRRRGYDGATMREIARAAGMSLGAAYHYFASKEAIVMAWYEASNDEQDRLLAERCVEGAPLGERLDAIFQSKIDAAAADRKLLGVVFRAVGDPGHPLSPFSRRTAAIRERNIESFEALFPEDPAPVRRPLGRALWLVQLGLLLALIYDPTGGDRTRRLARTLAKRVGQLAPLLRSPAAGPLLAEIAGLFDLDSV